MFMTQPIHRAMLQKPDATAIIFRDTAHTYRQFKDGVANVAGILAELGMDRGDRIGILGTNSDLYVELIYGIWWGGGVVNAVNTRWSAQEIAYSLDDCDTRILFVDDAFAGLAEQLLALSGSLKILVYTGTGETPAGMQDLRSLRALAQSRDDALRCGDEIAAVMYTGGTTGRPKGVALSHNNLGFGMLATLQASPRDAGSVSMHAAPMFHIGGLGLIFQQFGLLNTMVILPAFDEVAILDAIERHKCTLTFLVPTMMKMIIEHPSFPTYDVSSMRTIQYGASPIDEALLQQAMTAFPNAEFTQLYGMTELSPVITVLRPHEHITEPGQPNKLRSAGQPISIAEIRIVDEAGTPLPTGQVGEITARGPMVMAGGYWNKPEQTADAIRDGWMHTGDGGYFDEDGYLFVVDRIKDMIISGGENIYSSEVENTISQLPEVSMSAVIGVPDEKWGESVHAIVVLREGSTLSEAEIIAHCRDQIAHYKCPRTVEFRESLPLSAAGKLLKFQLKAEIRDLAATG